MARPTKFTPALGAQAVDMLGLGWTRRELAEDLGLGVRTLQAWLARGRAGDPTYAAFATAFDAAAVRMHWVRHAYSCRRSAASWRRFAGSRAGWWLGRLGPEEFWRRRLAWLEAKGRFTGSAHDRAEAGLEATRGFRTKVTP